MKGDLGLESPKNLFSEILLIENGITVAIL